MRRGYQPTEPVDLTNPPGGDEPPERAKPRLTLEEAPDVLSNGQVASVLGTSNHYVITLLERGLLHRLPLNSAGGIPKASVRRLLYEIARGDHDALVGPHRPRKGQA